MMHSLMLGAVAVLALLSSATPQLHAQGPAAPTPPAQPFPPCGRVPGMPEGERFCIAQMALTPGVLVIRDSATWALLWRRHGVSVTARNGAPLSLAVGTDFSRQQVLVVSYGLRPRCAEDSTFVARVERTAEGMVARLRSPIDSFVPEPERPVWYDEMDTRNCFGAVHVDVLRLPAGELSWRPLRASGLVPPPADWVSTPSADALERMPRRTRSKWVVRLLRERETPAAVRAAARRLAVRDTNYDALNVAMLDSSTWRDSAFLRSLAYVDYERHSYFARRLFAGRFGAALAADRETPRYELRLLADALRDLQGDRVQGVGAPERASLARALVANQIVRTSEPLLAALVGGAHGLPDVHRDACALYMRQWPAWRDAAWQRGEGRLRPRASCETER